MSLRELLAHSIDSQEFVRVHREAIEEGYLDGRVLALGDEWLLLATVQQGYRPNGVVWLRIEDLSAIDLPSPRDATATRVLELRGEALDACESLPVGSIGEAISAAAARYGLVTIYTEVAYPDECSVGTPVSVDDESVMLQTIDPDARWHAEPERFELADITRIDAGGEYETALHLLLRANASA